jgi:hypothetical protein
MLIALIAICVPAIQGMELNMSAELQKKYDNLKTIIQRADVEGFKSAFDGLESVEKKDLAEGLKQSVTEAKMVINKETEDLGDSNKNWSKIIKGSLANISGLWAGISIPLIGYMAMIELDCKKRDEFKKKPLNEVLPLLILGLPGHCGAFLVDEIFLKNTQLSFKMRIIVSAITASIMSLGTAYKAIPYGIKIFKDGLNYKQYLQDQLTKLDAIAEHIAQAKV